MIFFSFFYFTESKKTKYIYEKIININLQSQTINDKVIVENKEVSINESYKKKVLSKASKKIVEKKVTEVKKKVINNDPIPLGIKKLADNKIKIEEKKKYHQKLKPLKQNLNSENLKTKTSKKFSAKEKTQPFNKYVNGSKSYSVVTEKKNESKASLTKPEIQIFNKYSSDLKILIQNQATKNYPKISTIKNEEGYVEIKFTIDINGNIANIKVGEGTNAHKRLINSSIKSLNQISPYKKNKILKKKNTFSVIIVYKLQ
tara:strand:- start:155 stop:931 length:777 start_codon:yes stop_codon:yes gene_type:complete